MSNYIVGVDPGATCGWALLRNDAAPRLIGYGQVKFGDNSTATSALREIMAARRGGCIVVIEDQYVAQNIRSTIILAQRAGRWVEAAAELNYTPTMVNPKTWQAAELGLTRAKRTEVKRAAIAKVRGLYGVMVSDHEADAILIARWCAIVLGSG